MATRFYFRENGTAPITPALNGAWSNSASPFARKPMFTSTATDALTTVTGFSSTAGQVRCHRQFISEPMAAGITFNTGTTYKCYVQGLESAANDNVVSRMGVRILSQDGSTVRHVVLSVADYSTATEWNTALRNKAFANGDAGTGSYTTVAGDRLVVEIGHSDSAGASISADSRWGSQSTGVTDLGENETSTSTTERPWFETSAPVTFIDTLTLADTAAPQTSSYAAGVAVAGTLANAAAPQTSTYAVGVKVAGTLADSAAPQSDSYAAGAIVGVALANAAAPQTSSYSGTVAGDTDVSGDLVNSAPPQTGAYAVGVKVAGTLADSSVAQTSSYAAGTVVGGTLACIAAAQGDSYAAHAIAGVTVANAGPAQFDALAARVVVGAIFASAAAAQTSIYSSGYPEILGDIANAAAAPTSSYAVSSIVGAALACTAASQSSAIAITAPPPPPILTSDEAYAQAEENALRERLAATARIDARAALERAEREATTARLGG